jgi:type IV pilus assembly protein PilE
VKNMYKRKHTQGFTLIELMITIGIIAILAAVGIPSYQAQLAKGRASVAKGDLLNLAAKLEIYKQGNFSYTGATAADLYSTGSPAGNTSPDFTLNIEVKNSGRDYRLSAVAVSAVAADDGDYTFNPKGQNCHFPSGVGASIPDTCAGGSEWN